MHETCTYISSKIMEHQFPSNIVDFRLDEIAHTAPQVIWTTEIEDSQYGLTVTLPYSNYISGTFFMGHNNRSVYIDIFSVEKSLQKSGIGTRLLRSFTNEARTYEAQELLTRCTSLGSLKTLARVFEETNLRYYAVSAMGKLENAIPQTYAILLQQAATTGIIDIGVGIDISLIDTSSWENTRPICPNPYE